MEPLPDLSESRTSRAGVDTRRVLGTLRFMISVATLDILAAGGALATAAALGASGITYVLAIMLAAGIGTFAAIGLVWVVQYLFWAPVRQRDEARESLRALQEHFAISFDPETAWDWRTSENPKGFSGRIRRCHVRVENRTTDEIKDCYGQILRCVTFKGGNWLEYEDFERDDAIHPQYCKWIAGVGGIRTLRPMHPADLLLCLSHEGSESAYLAPSKAGPDDRPMDYATKLVPGRYRVRLYVKGVGVPPMDRFFEIKFDGHWKNLIVHEIPGKELPAA